MAAAQAVILPAQHFDEVDVKLLFVAAIFFLQVPLKPDPSVQLTGTLVDSSGTVVQDGIVDILPRDYGYSGPLPTVRTDDAGHFTISGFPRGAYTLMPWKEADGVPNPAVSVFEAVDAGITVVRIGDVASSKPVVLRLPAPGYRVTFTVRDSSSGQKIFNSRVKIARTEAPSIYLTKGVHDDGEVSFLLPRRQLSVLISAPDYEDWVTVVSAPEDSNTKNSQSFLVNLTRKKVAPAH